MGLKKVLLGSFIMIYCAAPLFGDVDKKDKSGKKTNVEAAEYPIDMDRNYDDLLQLWATKGGDGIECEYSNEAAVLCDDSTYMQRLYALPSEMELAYNSVVRQFIEMYANRRRGQVSYMLGQGRYYFPMFEEALDKEGLPMELKYLPVIESALNPIARSRAGATGLWQFMSGTGKMYKLEINSLVDERRDPYKSTQAAVQYLKDMYEVYQDWNLVIAAYNCGPGNVNKAIRRSGGKRDYWDIYPYLPKETRGYVPAFIAATYIMSYYPEHKICPREADFPALVDTLSINKLVHFEQIADMINVSVDDIRKLNPQYKNDIIPGEYKEYALKLPIHDLGTFIENADTIYAHRADEFLTHQRVRGVTLAKGRAASGGGGYATYKVKKGDTLGAIAMRHGISVSQLKSWNNLSSDRLNIGRALQVSAYVVPVKNGSKEKVNTASVQNEKKTEYLVDNGVLKKATTVTKTVTSSYKVERGDTWQRIAKKTGESVANLRSWNGGKKAKLLAGNNLKISKTETVEEFTEVSKPANLSLEPTTYSTLAYIDNYLEGLDLVDPSAVFANSTIEEDEDSDDLEDTMAIYHKVVFGETLSQIAEKYNVTIDDILSWNNVTKENSSNISRLLILAPYKEDVKQVANNNIDDSANTIKL